jgi:hypothetical protein
MRKVVCYTGTLLKVLINSRKHVSLGFFFNVEAATSVALEWPGWEHISGARRDVVFSPLSNFNLVVGNHRSVDAGEVDGGGMGTSYLCKQPRALCLTSALLVQALRQV